MSDLRYNFPMRLMHWLYAAIAIFTLALGFYMVGLPNEAKSGVYALHKSLGVVLFILLILRILTRRFSHIPELPDSISSPEKLFAKIGIFVLYILMLIMPLSGYVMSSASGRAVYLFAFELPNLLPLNNRLAGLNHMLHVNVCYLLVLAIALHVLFAFKHLFFDKTNLFTRIWRVG